MTPLEMWKMDEMQRHALAEFHRAAARDPERLKRRHEDAAGNRHARRRAAALARDRKCDRQPA